MALVHVDAFLISFAIFLTWGFIGYGVVGLLGRHFATPRRWLLAPVAGLASSALVATVVNKLGFPAKSFGWPLLGVMLAASALYCVLQRPNIAWRKAAVWLAALIAVALLVAWPLLEAGTDWVSTGNGDMTTYILGANHFYAHGFYQLPSEQELLSDADRSWAGSFVYSIGEVRSTSQLVLGWFMAVSGLTASQGYMMLMVAFHLVVLVTVAAFVCNARGRESVALAALLVIGSSANVALGTFIQLMPQDFGIALSAASAIVLLDRPASGRSLYAQGALGGMFFAALLIAYPEMSPFVVVALVAFCAIALLRRELPIRRWLGLLGISFAAVLAFGNFGILGALHFLLWNLQYSSHPLGGVNALFPYYLTPIGFAQGWGLAPQGSGDFSSWEIQGYVVAGAALFLAAIVTSARAAWRMEAVSVVACCMLMFFPPLFVIHNGFGLYKLAMYAQPFVLGALTIAVWEAFAGRARGRTHS